MTHKLVRKDDHSIEVNRTAEVVYGTCDIDNITLNEKGEMVIDYACAGTTLNWDSQQQLKENGKLIYVDENDNELTEDEVELVEDLGEIDASDDDENS